MKESFQEVKDFKKRTLRRVFTNFTEYWLTDGSFGLLLLILLFTIFILPILIEYGHVEMIFVNLVFLFLFFTGIWSSTQRYLIIFTASYLGIGRLMFIESLVQLMCICVWPY